MNDSNEFNYLHHKFRKYSFSKLHSFVACEDVEVLARCFAVGNGGVGGRRESGRSVQSIAIRILLALNDDNAEINFKYKDQQHPDESIELHFLRAYIH